MFGKKKIPIINKNILLKYKLKIKLMFSSLILLKDKRFILNFSLKITLIILI